VFNVDEAAEKLRREPYHLFRNDCIIKSIRLVRECRKHNIAAKFVWCALGLEKARLPVVEEVPFLVFIHAWVEVDDRRIETSRPIGSPGFMGLIPSKIRPIITIKF
jgi:hypothetical protein